MDLSRRSFLSLLALPLAAAAALTCGCANQDAAVREAAAAAIDSLAAGEAFPNNDWYPLLPDERLSSLGSVHEPIYKVCTTALERMDYELGEVAVDGDTATVEVHVTAPDLFAALVRAQEDVNAFALSEEGSREIAVREDINQQARYLCDWLLEYLSAHLADQDIEVLELSATAYLTRGEDGSWQLDFAENPELLEALFCVR